MKNLALKNLALGPGEIMGNNNATLPGSVNVTSINNVYHLLGVAAEWLLGIFLALAVVMFIWAAYLYLFGGDNEDKIKEANNRLKWGAVAVVVALIPFAAILRIQDILSTGGGGSASCLDITSWFNICSNDGSNNYVNTNPTYYQPTNHTCSQDEVNGKSSNQLFNNCCSGRKAGQTIVCFQ